MTPPKILLSTALISLCLYANSAAANAIYPIIFAKGTTSGLAKGEIKSADDMEYVLRANKGQAMAVKLTTKSPLIHFNVLKKGLDKALFDGAKTKKNSWSGSLPANGDYLVKVYSTGKDKKGEKTTPFSLSFSIK